ncbi:hypothetical protein E2C01_080252 [Portunus trituberculatus]|uniref:Secreted protein n=1 Tax=Portunus trituberculatus TaxID=210409 RepID=A0A5B7IZ26_PORTR|nr:hypothetical protein [Portunus trituberculatus]
MKGITQFSRFLSFLIIVYSFSSTTTTTTTSSSLYKRNKRQAVAVAVGAAVNHSKFNCPKQRGKKTEGEGRVARCRDHECPAVRSCPGFVYKQMWDRITQRSVHSAASLAIDARPMF